MTRNDIIARFKELGFSPEECWLQTGGAMVMLGMREHTHDMDMGCTKALAERVLASGAPYVILPDGRRKFDIGGDVELSEEWERGTVTVIDGVPVVSPADIIRCKRNLGREKDFRDIALIESFLAETN